nr:MAG TPA: hypothetical protein [Caudoviricetes sp.]
MTASKGKTTNQNTSKTKTAGQNGGQAPRFRNCTKSLGHQRRESILFVRRLFKGGWSCEERKSMR